MKPRFYIEKFNSKDGPRFRIKARNGKVICSSEAYSSKRKRDMTIDSILFTWWLISQVSERTSLLVNGVVFEADGQKESVK